MCISLYVVTFSKMAPQAKPLCPLDSYRNSVQNPGLNVSKGFTRPHFHREKLQTQFPGQNVNLNFQVTAAATTAAATAAATGAATRRSGVGHGVGESSVDPSPLILPPTPTPPSAWDGDGGGEGAALVAGSTAAVHVVAEEGVGGGAEGEIGGVSTSGDATGGEISLEDERDLEQEIHPQIHREISLEDERDLECDLERQIHHEAMRGRRMAPLEAERQRLASLDVDSPFVENEPPGVDDSPPPELSMEEASPQLPTASPQLPTASPQLPTASPQLPTASHSPTGTHAVARGVGLHRALAGAPTRIELSAYLPNGATAPISPSSLSLSLTNAEGGGECGGECGGEGWRSGGGVRGWGGAGDSGGPLLPYGGVEPALQRATPDPHLALEILSIDQTPSGLSVSVTPHFPHMSHPIPPICHTPIPPHLSHSDSPPFVTLLLPPIRHAPILLFRSSSASLMRATASFTCPWRGVG